VEKMDDEGAPTCGKLGYVGKGKMGIYLPSTSSPAPTALH